MASINSTGANTSLVYAEGQVSAQIICERESLVFTAGETIKGIVHFDSLNGDDVDRRILVYDLQLVVVGGTLSDGHVCRPFRRFRFFSAHKFTKSPHVPYCVRKDGEHEFELTLPTSLWSTFKGIYGSREYALCLVCRRGEFLEFGTEILRLASKEVIIIALVEPPPPRTPRRLNDSFHKTTSYEAAGVRGVVKLAVNLDKTCATPGEFLSVHVNIDNGLPLPLSTVKIFLKQHIFFNMPLSRWTIVKSPYDTRIILQKEGPSIAPGPGRKINWKGGFQVPHVIPSDLESVGNKYIKVSYFVTVSISKFVSLCVQVPIRICTARKDEIVGEGESDTWETASTAYGLEMCRSNSQFSLDSDANADTWSLASMDVDFGSSWSLVDLGQGQRQGSSSGGGGRRRSGSISGCSVSSGGSAPPPYDSTWRILMETPPPIYNHVVGVDEDSDN